MPANSIRNQQMFIDGALTDAFDGGKFEKRNPFTGEVIARVAAAGRQDAARAVEAASAAFSGLERNASWNTPQSVFEGGRRDGLPSTGDCEVDYGGNGRNFRLGDI